MVIKFVCDAVLWFDKVNGNTYHSCRITRTGDGKVICAPFQYGYGSAYKESALVEMIKAKWIPKKYNTRNMYLYDRENKYPVLWNSSTGTKKECIANGTK